MGIDIYPANYNKFQDRRPLTNNTSVGTRIFGGRMGTLDNTTVKTFHVAMEVETEFDGVRAILANTSGVISDYVQSAKVSVWGDASDLNNSAGTWSTLLTNSNSTFPTTLASVNNSNRIGYITTDWLSIQSVPRTDGGTKPLVGIRLYISSVNATLPVVGNGTDNFTNWATRTDGLLWCMRQQDGDAVGTPSNFTSTTNVSQSPIIGLQFLSRGKIINVMGVGDSITEGRGTYLGEGFILPSCKALSGINGVAISYSNCGWSGQPSTSSVGYTLRALEILDNEEIRPDIMLIPNGSPNSHTTITAQNVGIERYYLAQIIDKCAEKGVTPVVWSWLPSNSSIDTPTGSKNYGATDSLRVALNQEVLGWREKGLTVVDFSTVLNGTINANGQIPFATGTTTDAIHPNDAGNARLTDILTPVLRNLIS